MDVYKILLCAYFVSEVLSLAPPPKSIQAEIQEYLDEQSRVAKDLLKSYDKRFIPAKPGKPLQVTLEVVVSDILRIENMEAQMIVFIKLNWYDYRLSWNSTKRLKVREHFLDKIWLPDIRIINLKDAKRFEGFGGINMNIYPNGKVYFSQAALITTSCPMDLHKFPMDRQTCFLNFSTFAYGKSLLNFSTDGKHVFIKHSKLPQFDLVETKEIEGVGKKASAVSIGLTFQRRFGYYLMSIYIPSTSIVVLSWLAFFMEPSNIADRIALEITMTLTIVFLLDVVNEGISHVSYAKASDVFVIVSFGFIFLALLETMLVFRLSDWCKTKKHNGKHSCKFSACCKRKPRKAKKYEVEATESDILNHIEPTIKCCCTNWASWIDKICIIMFPTMYLTFNIVYWKYYTTVNK